MAQIGKLKYDDSYTEGRWFDLKLDDGVIKLKIAMKGNPKYTLALEKEYKGDVINALTGNTNQTQEERRQSQARLYSETILLDWENMDDEDGNPIPYSKEKCYEFLVDPAYADLFAFVDSCSTQTQLYKIERVQKVGKGQDNS